MSAQPKGLSPQTADNAAYYAAVCANKLDNDDAEYRLLQFLKQRPNSTHVNMVRLHLGNYYYRRGKYKEALMQYRQVDKHDIECHTAGKDYRYRIADSDDDSYFHRWLLDSLSLNRIIEDSKDAAQYIGVEKSNTDNLPADFWRKVTHFIPSDARTAPDKCDD